MSPPQYKFHYFDGRGLGEVFRDVDYSDAYLHRPYIRISTVDTFDTIVADNVVQVARMIFAQAGVKYEDHRYAAGSDDWKAIAPFGQLPVLEIDGGVKIAQSCAIARYLAKQYGLAGKSPIEEALVDSLADAFKDFFTECRPYFSIAFGFLQGDKEEKYKELVVPAKEKLFPALDKFLEMSGSGFLVGKSVTWVDLFIAEWLETLHEHKPTLFDGHPEIPKWIHHVRDLPKIKQWINERPKTKF